jgi:hypothetical protein
MHRRHAFLGLGGLLCFALPLILTVFDVTVESIVAFTIVMAVVSHSAAVGSGAAAQEAEEGETENQGHESSQVHHILRKLLSGLYSERISAHIAIAIQ